MRYFFYNSFTLGSGYKYAELKDNAICETQIPYDIDCDFCNGGCQMVVRNTNNDKSIFILKGILYENDEKRFDEQGRKVTINFAIEATLSEQKILNNIFFAIIAEWANLCKYLGDSIIIPFQNGSYGYGIEQSRIDLLVQYLSQYNTESIKKEIGIKQSDLNAIVLKSSDLSYYETLAKDFYRSKHKCVVANFIRKNVITGDVFAKLTSKTSTDDYNEFVMNVNKGKTAPLVLKDKELESHTKREPAFPCEDKESKDKDSETETNNELNNGSLSSINTHKKEIKKDFHLKLCPFIIFIVGFISGLILGYIIFKQIK